MTSDTATTHQIGDESLTAGATASTPNTSKRPATSRIFECRLTPQLSGRMITRPARRVCTMK